MEFVKVLTEMFDRNNLNEIKDPNKLINTFVLAVKSEDDSIKFHQLNYLLGLPKVGNFIFKIYQTHIKRQNVSTTISELVDDFSSLEIAPSIYAYFIYCVLKALRIDTEELAWINPTRNTLRNMSIGMDQSFGYGLYNEDVYDYEVDRGTVVKCLRDKKYMTIPNKVTRIAEHAFRHISSMEFLTIPETVEALTPNNFSDSPELGRIILPNNIKDIPSNYLKNAHKLFVVVARGVTDLGPNCFEATRLSSVKNIGGGNLEYIGDQAFKDCFQLKKLEFNNLKEVGNSPFYNCINATDIIITVNEDLIKNKFQIYKLFEQNSKDMSNYTGLKNIIVEAKDGIIPDGFFEDCSTITNIKVLGEVNHIGKNAFKGCTSLENLEIDFKGTLIESGVFEDCLRLVFFPKFINVEEIGANAFKGCASLDDLIFYKPIVKLHEKCFMDCIVLKKITIRLITDILPAYTFSGCASLLDFSFTNNIKHIGSYAFQGIELPINYSLPAKINTISKFAYDNCTFTKLTIPNDCNIDELAFSNIRPINELNIENLEIYNSKGEYIELFKLFEETSETFNTKFTTLKTLNVNTEVVPSNAFNNWVNIEVINLSENIIEISESSFEGCTSLNSVYLDSFDLVIKENAFKNCINLVKIRTQNNDLPDTRGVYDLSICNRIEKDAFFNCNIDELYLTITKDTEPDSFLLGDIFKKEVKVDNFLRYINVDCTDGVLVKQLFENCSTVKNIKITGVVNKLEDNLFSGCSSLENLEVEYDGNEITSHCFANCSKLVRFPNFENVKIINEYAFFGCTSLPSAKFTKRIDVIGKSAFENCTSLKEIDMEFYGLSLETDTFKACPSLSNFHFIKSVEILETNSLSNINLVNKFILPESVKIIRKDAFNGSTLGSELILNSNVIYEEEAFNNVKGINKLTFNNLMFSNNDKVVLPYQIFSNSIETFNKKYDAIKSVDINTNNICDSAFKGWKNLTKILLTHKVESLSNSCFEDCGFEKITLPYFNMSLGENTFSNCHNLSKIAFENNFLENPTNLLLPKKAFNNCKKIEDIYIYLNQNILENNLTLSSFFAENDEIFNKNLTKLKNVVIVNEVKEIPVNFFRNCKRLVNVKIINEVEKFNENTFENCNSLESISVNFKGNTLPNNLFKDCQNLENLFNYDSVDTIGDYTFSNCKKITNLGFSKDIISLGENTFENCTNLTDIAMKYTGEKMQKECFLNCKKLVRTPKFTNLTHLEESCFSGCKELKVISITSLQNTNMNKLFSTLKTIEKVNYNSIDIPNEFFKNVVNVNEIIFEQKLATIGDSAFENCTNIKSINNIDEVEYLGDNVFKNSNLNTIKLPETIISYGKGIFALCNELIDIELPVRFDFIGTIFSGSESNNSKEITQMSFGIERKFFIPKSVEKITINSGEISEGAFSNIDTELVINVKLNKVKDYTFYNCKNIVLPYMNDIKDIGDFAFSNVEMDRLELNNVFTIGHSAFKDAKINDLIVGEKVNVMNSTSFEGVVFDNFIIQQNKFFKYDSNLIIDVKKAIILNVFDCNEELIIPSEIQTIDSNIFVDKDIKVLDTNNVKTIKSNAFVNCSLEKIKFKKVEKFSANILSNCVNIKSIELPFIGLDIKTPKNIDFLFDFEKTSFDLIKVDGGTFSNNTFKNIKTIETLDLCNTKKTCLEENTLKNITINKLILPNALEEINDNAFNNVLINEVICNNDGNIKYSDDCIYVNKKLAYCTKEEIENVILNNNVDAIAVNAFKLVTKINNLEMSNKELSYTGLFEQIKEVNTLTIANLTEKPVQLLKKSINTVKEFIFTDNEINLDFFRGITRFEKLIFKQITKFNIDMFTKDKDKKSSYKKENIYVNYLSIEQPIKEIDEAVFEYITISDLDVRSGENYSCLEGLLFDLNNNTLIYAAKGIKGERKVPNFVNYTKEGSFKNCTELNSITFDNILSISNSTFENCNNLNTVIINDNCEEIGDTIFKNCNNFKFIQIPFVGANKENYDNVSYLFEEQDLNKKIDCIYITNQDIIEETFTNNNFINTIILGEKVNEIKKGSFAQCKNLSKVYIDQEVKSVEDFTFEGCNRGLKVFVNKKTQKTWPIKWNKLTDKKMFSTVKVSNKKVKLESYK